MTAAVVISETYFPRRYFGKWSLPFRRREAERPWSSWPASAWLPRDPFGSSWLLLAPLGSSGMLLPELLRRASPCSSFHDPKCCGSRHWGCGRELRAIGAHSLLCPVPFLMIRGPTDRKPELWPLTPSPLSPAGSGSPQERGRLMCTKPYPHLGGERRAAEQEGPMMEARATAPGFSFWLRVSAA